MILQLFRLIGLKQGSKLTVLTCMDTQKSSRVASKQQPFLYNIKKRKVNNIRTNTVHNLNITIVYMILLLRKDGCCWYSSK